MEEEQHPRKAKINFKKYTSVEIENEKIPKNVDFEYNTASKNQTKKQKYGNRNKSVVAANFLRKPSHGIKDSQNTLTKQKKNKNKKYSVVEDIDTKFMNFNKSHQKKKAKKSEEKKVSSRKNAKKKQKDLFYSKSKNAKINAIIEDLRKRQETAEDIRYANDNVGKLKIKIDVSKKKPENIEKNDVNEKKIIAPKIQEKIESIKKKPKKNKDENNNINNNTYNGPEQFDSEKDENNNFNNDEIERLKAEIREKEEEIEKLKREKNNYKPVKRVMKLKPIRYNSFVLVEEVINENDENQNKKNDQKINKKNNNIITKSAMVELNNKVNKNQNIPKKKYSKIEYQNFNFCYYKIPEENYQSKNYKKLQKYEPEFQTSLFLLRDYSDSESEENQKEHKKSIKIKKPIDKKEQTSTIPIKKKQTNNKKKSIIENKSTFKKSQNFLRASGKFKKKRSCSIRNKRSSSVRNKRSSSVRNKRQSVKDFIRTRRKELFEQNILKNEETLKKKPSSKIVEHPENEILEDDEGVKYIIFRKTHFTKIKKNENNENNEESEDTWLYKEFVISHQVSVTLKAIKEMEQNNKIKNQILIIHNNKVPTNIQKNQNKNSNIKPIQKQNIKTINKNYQLKTKEEESEEESEEEKENENKNINNNQKKNINIPPPKRIILKNPILTNYNESDTDEEEEEEEIEPQPKIIKKTPVPIDKKKLYKKYNDLLLTYEEKKQIQTEPNEIQEINIPSTQKKVVIKDEDFYKNNKTIYSDLYNEEKKRMMDFKKKLSKNKFRKDKSDNDSKLISKKVKSKKAKIKILVRDEKHNKKKHYNEETENSKIRKNLSTDRRFGDQQNFQLYGKVYSGSTSKKGRNQFLPAENNTYYPEYENPLETRRKIMANYRTKEEKLNSGKINNSAGKKFRGRK